MLQQIFTVYDSKAEMYLTPFYQNTINQARRVFSDIINNHEHQFSKNPEDYTLFHVGEYNDKDASFNMLDTPASLQLGLEIVKLKTVPLEPLYEPPPEPPSRPFSLLCPPPHRS